MCVCHCVEATERTHEIDESGSKPQLFNWITVLLVSIWMGIVVVAAELAAAEDQSVTLDAFLKSLI